MDWGHRHFTARLPHTRFAAPATRPLLFPRHTARFATNATRNRFKQPLAHLYCIHPTPLKVASTRDSDVPSYIWTLEPCRLAQVKLQSPCTLLSARFVRCFHLSTIIQPSCIIQHHCLVTNKWCSVGCICYSNSGAPTLGKISIDKFSAHLTYVCIRNPFSYKNISIFFFSIIYFTSSWETWNTFFPHITFLISVKVNNFRKLSSSIQAKKQLIC